MGFGLRCNGYTHKFNTEHEESQTDVVTIAQDAWSRGQPLAVHGWIYGLRDGTLRDLGMTITTADEAAPAYERALAILS